MSKSKPLVEVKDDELNISAVFYKDHKPKNRRPNESLHVTVPMFNAVQSKQRELKQELSYNTKEMFVWLCNQAGITIEPAWLDKRLLSVRQADEQKVNATATATTPEMAKADNTSIEIDAETLQKVKDQLAVNDEATVRQLLKSAFFGVEVIDKYLLLAKLPEAETVANPFI